MRIRILGCGTSTGVPRIGNDWGRCDPAEPRNRRSRASILIEVGGTRILVDTSPDMREQLLAAGIGTVDAILWTHDHADHVNGIDDIRQLFHNGNDPVPGYARPATRAVIEHRFGYVFRGTTFYPAVARLLDMPDRLVFDELTISIVDQPHGAITAAGLVLECGGRRIVYATDFHELTPAMKQAYRGADLWIVDALRREPHPSHPHLAQAIAWTRELSIGRAVLVHMDKSMDYRSLLDELPPGIEPAFDGMVIEA